MKNIIKISFLLVFAILIFTPTSVGAHQPRINEQTETIVVNPEVSKVYYGKLGGKSPTYIINSDKTFNLYVNVLVPDIKDERKNVSAVIFKDANFYSPIAILDATKFEWIHFWEKFGRDWYWQGPEYKARVDAGKYEILIWSNNNDSKYALAIGEIETFNGKEIINALKLIPKIKRDFFNESPIGLILSPFGWGYILIMYVLAFVTGLIYRAILKKFTKNIDKKDRLFRLALGIGLLIWAITTTWNPILLFLSGFAIFKAIHKNTRPAN